jgi:hypothetical protein
MIRIALLSIVFMAAVAMVGCAGHVPPATTEQKAALIEKVKSLAGTWETIDEKGHRSTASVFTVSSAGSAVREVLFPGSPHEMTNMYTMDGPSLLMTHYCAQGNQPHMRAVAGSASGDRLMLKFDSVSNMTAPNELYMGELTIVFKDADHIREEWRSFRGGKPAEHSPAFELVRRK